MWCLQAGGHCRLKLVFHLLLVQFSSVQSDSSLYRGDTAHKKPLEDSASTNSIEEVHETSLGGSNGWQRKLMSRPRRWPLPTESNRAV